MRTSFGTIVLLLTFIQVCLGIGQLVGGFK